MSVSMNIILQIWQLLENIAKLSSKCIAYLPFVLCQVLGEDVFLDFRFLLPWGPLIWAWYTWAYIKHYKLYNRNSRFWLLKSHFHLCLWVQWMRSQFSLSQWHIITKLVPHMVTMLLQEFEWPKHQHLNFTLGYSPWFIIWRHVWCWSNNA